MHEQLDFDVIIVGGGIAGSTLGANLAQNGLRVEILEREIEFTDRVRGEWMAPWGVAETKNLGIYQRLISAGGHHTARAINYDELLSPAQAEANEIDLSEMHPEVPGPLCMEHVVMQNECLAHAAEAGAVIRRGVTQVEITADAPATATFVANQQSERHTCRMIVGADGRSSIVRRQLGLALDETKVDHLISGLLIDGATEWPSDLQSIGKAGDAMYLVFPQGEGKIRLYLDYGLADRGRYTGKRGTNDFLHAFDQDCLPYGAHLANANPIGPCRAFPSQDAALNDPFVANAVLIGDAGGYTDPIFGQGLSNALRDARIVRDLLIANQTWSIEMFASYGEERNERLRRIMQVTRFATKLFARFDERGVQARTRAMQRMAENPDLGALLGAAFAGPDALPAECFSYAFVDQIFAE